MMSVENNQECFVVLWRRLERTRRLLGGQYKRFCIRNVLKSWFPADATDDFIWEICHLAAVDDEPQEGWNELPVPSLYPRKHRELLRAIVAVRTGISFWKINLKALDKAYSIAFPNSTPINVNKKKRMDKKMKLSEHLTSSSVAALGNSSKLDCTRLTPHFTLGELTKTSVKIDNVPNEEQVNNLKRVCGWLEK